MSTLKILNIETNDPKTFGILDTSEYDSTPSVLSIEITPPGFTRVTLPYEQSSLTIFNAPTLQIDCTEADLPDGIYKVKLSFNPAYENYIEEYFYRTMKLESIVDEAFLKSNLSRCGKPSREDRMAFDDIYLFIRGAKAAANKCDYTLAEELYQKASKLVHNYLKTNHKGC